MNSREIVEKVVDEIFECPFYSVAQVERAVAVLDEKFKDNKKQFAKELLNLPLDELLAKLEEAANG